MTLSSHYAATRQWLPRALAATPGGAQTLSRRPDRLVHGAYPAAFVRQHGAYGWDVDGHRYVDYWLGLASITLGHGHPLVLSAVRRQLLDGVAYSVPSRLETEVAERLAAVVPCAQDRGQVRWLKTGSEASEAAMRTARIATGRDLVAVCGYRGWHSTQSAAKPYRPGIPDGYAQSIVEVPFNDAEALDALYRERKDDLAAVFVDVVFDQPPQADWLECLDRCRDVGALLIFDEVVAGFRFARAGGQEWCDATPDLATFGKAMAAGFPLAALVGPERLMRHAWPASGTFGGEALSLAAANAVLDLYEPGHASNPLFPMWTAGRSLLSGLDAQWAGVTLGPLRPRVIGFPVRMRQRFLPVEPGADVAEAARWTMALWLQETARRGVLFHPGGWNVAGAHLKGWFPGQDDGDLAPIEATLAAHAEVVTVLQEAWDSGAIKARVEGEPPVEGVRA